MGSIHPFAPAALILGILGPSPTLTPELIDEIQCTFGEILDQSPVIPYTHSDYYTAEMGPTLYKQWVLIPISQLANPTSRYKLQSQSIEARYSIENHRRYNIDPGLLFAHQLMLFSTKNYAHRIPISDGIYAELELIFQGKQWNSLSWTYPDYSRPEILEFFTKSRLHIIKL